MPGTRFHALLRPLADLACSRHACKLGCIVGGLSAAVVLFFAALALRLFLGPITLGPLAGTLSGAIAHAMPPGLVMKYDQAAIEWSRDEGKVSLVVLGTRVYDADGDLLVRAPKADIDVAALPLFDGRVQVQRIALVGVELTLVYGADGHFRLGVGKTPAERNVLQQVIDAISESKGPSTLKQFSVRHARLAFIDEAIGLAVASPDANIRLTRDGHGDHLLRLRADLDLAGRRARLRGRFVLPADMGPPRGHMTLDGLALDGLAAQAGNRYWAQNAPMKADISADFAPYAKDGKPDLGIEIRAEAHGRLRPSFAETPLNVSRLALEARFERAANTLTIRRLSISADRLKAHLRGTLHVARDDAGTVQRIDADLSADEIAVGMHELFAAPVTFREIALRGAWTMASRTFAFDRLTVAAEPFAITAAGSATFAKGQSPQIDAEGGITRMGVRDLVRYWPLFAAPNARDWVDTSMPAGEVGPTRFALRIPAGGLDAPALPKSAVTISFPVEEAEADYVTGLTHLTHARGRAVLTGTDFTVDVEAAKVGALTLTAARFYVPDVNADTSIGRIDVRLQGAVDEILRQIDKKPLRYPTRFGIDPAAAKGTASVEMHIQLPLEKDVRFDDVRLDVRAATHGFSMALGPKLHLSDGEIVFAIRNTDLHATGTTGLGGSPGRLAVDWTEDFDSRKKVTTTITVKGAFDDGARKSVGLPTEAELKGPVTVSGSFVGHGGLVRQASVDIDFAPATIDIARTTIVKPTGFPLFGHLAMAFSPHSLPTTASLSLKGPGTDADVAMQFGPDGDLEFMRIPRLRFGARNDFAYQMTDNRLGKEISISGRIMDGTRLMRAAASPAPAGGNGGGSGAPHPFHLSVGLDTLALHGDVTVENLSVDVTSLGDRLSSVDLRGALAKTASIRGGMSQNEAGRTLRVGTDNAGALLKGLYGFSSMRGGKVELTAFMPGTAADPPPAGKNAPEATGTLTFKKFSVTDQPLLTRLFTAGSLVGLSNLMQGEGIGVESFEVPYTLRNGVISVHSARATGPAIGLTADGYIDPPQKTLALKGTLVPLYGINSVLGNIPLLGDVLTSKAGEGIFGMTYSIKGDVEEPSIDINPLSVLAPGIFRRLFEGRIPNAMQAPSNNLPPETPPTDETPAKP